MLKSIVLEPQTPLHQYVVGFRILSDQIHQTRRRENMVGVNMVGVNMVGVNNVAHDAICECFEGIMLEPCLLQPCFHVAGRRQDKYAQSAY